MKNLIFSIVVFCVYHSLQAQTIEGTVYDAKTKEAVAGVAIYLNGTSIITTSDRDGRFSLVVGQIINTTLVFSHLSYESLVIERPFEHREKLFFMREKVNVLAEATVIADRIPRTEKMKVFREQFLGVSEAGKSCVIVNEEDIVLSYDHNNYKLIGYSINPLIIENNYLAYRIVFDLREFTIEYSENTLNMVMATMVHYKGTSSFIDVSPYNTRFMKRREELFRRSPAFFWKNFINHTLDKSSLTIYNRLRKIEPEKYFIVSDVPPQREVRIIPETNLNNRHPAVRTKGIHGVIGIVYSNKYRSDAVFLSNRIYIDTFGNHNVDDIIYFGDMGEQRLGDTLPRDFRSH